MVCERCSSYSSADLQTSHQPVCISSSVISAVPWISAEWLMLRLLVSWTPAKFLYRHCDSTCGKSGFLGQHECL